MPSSHLILCHPLLLLPPTPPSIRVFSNESTLRMRWPKYWSFSFSIILSKEHPGLISFRMDWLDLLAVQGTWLQVSPKCQVQTGFQAYSSKKKWDLFCLLKFQLSLLQLLLIGSVTTKWQTKGLRFNHTRLRSRTWNSGILPIQCLFSKLRQSYAPFWQEVITVIVAQFPKLKLSRTLWGSGVQIC